MLEAVKLALRLTVDNYDSELKDLIDSAQLDLGIAGVEYESIDALVRRAVITYVMLHFSMLALTDGEYARLKASYDEQKGQMSMATGYTVWGDVR